ncbi:hypothetical protein MTP04_24180 [Lysinibacillus sp. PLM2]|nr:hypothetical protein MTP04_24180 [Lysinibacillus sp. PLM2]
MTRDQIRNYFNLGKVGNTNRVLRSLSDYLMTIRDGYQTIYYLSKEGREYVGCNKVRKKGGHVTHIIMRNDFWLFYKCPKDWRNEIKISNGKTSIVVDAMFNKDGFQCFLEVDHLQSMKENHTKIKRYKELMPSLALKLGHYPTIIWLTTTELRRKQLQQACDGLKAIVYTINEIK